MKFLKLKKSKQQYNVASKAMFVITVELLDNAMLECTLTAESTGSKWNKKIDFSWIIFQFFFFKFRQTSENLIFKIKCQKLAMLDSVFPLIGIFITVYEVIWFNAYSI